MTSCHQAERLARLLITCLSCFVTASWKYSHTGPPAVPSAVLIHWQGVWTCRLTSGSMTLYLYRTLKYLHSHYIFKRWKIRVKQTLCSGIWHHIIWQKFTIVSIIHNAYLFKVDNLWYEGWNFNSGNYLFTTDTKQIHVSKFYCPSM